jgi:hypothetical protein
MKEVETGVAQIVLDNSRWQIQLQLKESSVIANIKKRSIS